MEIIKSSDPQVILKSVEVLKNGGLVIYPTETCYGIGVDATNNEAVKKLLEYKKRPAGMPISIAVSSLDMANKFIEINNNAKHLFKEFTPGPVTIICKSLGKISKLIESETQTLGVRIPDYNLTLTLIENFGKPITTTSANPVGKKTPYSIEDVFNNISTKQKKLIDLIIDAGELPKNPPSTVIDTTTNDLTMYRKGFANVGNHKEVFVSKSVEDTIKIAEEIFEKYPSKIFLLNGNLGAGKTQFTKGIAQKLGIKQIIKSPTFTYVNEYKIPAESGQAFVRFLHHVDAWRISSIEDLHLLGLKNWFNKNNYCVIEWPSVLTNLDENILKDVDYLYVDIIIKSENEREILVY